MKQLLKKLFLGTIGGSLYYFIEVMFRGRSHISMFFLAGLIFIYSDIQNNYVSWDYPLWKQWMKVWGFTLTGEFITGCIVNLWLKLNIWDYSNEKFNVLGQCCPLFALIFLPLCLLSIILSDYINYWFFNERRPKYKFI